LLVKVAVPLGVSGLGAVTGAELGTAWWRFRRLA